MKVEYRAPRNETELDDTIECSLRAFGNLGDRRLRFTISCDPATLARDLSKIRANYEVCSLDLVDLFPMTYHFETVVGLRRYG